MKVKPAPDYSETELLFLSAGYSIRGAATASGAPQAARIARHWPARWLMARFLKLRLHRQAAVRREQVHLRRVAHSAAS